MGRGRHGQSGARQAQLEWDDSALPYQCPSVCFYPHVPFVSLTPMYTQVYHMSPLISRTGLGRPSPVSWKPPFMPWALPMSQPQGSSKKPRVIISEDFGVDFVLNPPGPTQHPDSQSAEFCLFSSAGEKVSLYVTHFPQAPHAQGPWVLAHCACT